MAKVSNAARNLLTALQELHEDDLWHLFGTAHALAKGRSVADAVEKRSNELRGYRLRRDVEAYIFLLQRAASAPLPDLDQISPKAGAAIAVCEEFERLKLPFSASNTGFAADCMRAVFRLAGLPGDDVKYWIAEAKKKVDRNLP